MRKTTLLAAAALAVALAAPGAGAQALARELIVGFTADAQTLDPANHRDRYTETILRNMYDGLVTRDADMKVVPELAESWTQVDPTTYEFRLREGVTFHDGTPLTVEDIKFTFDRLTQDGAMEGQTSPRKSLLGPLEATTIVDDRTIRFTLSQPWPLFVTYLPWQEVVSEAFVGKAGRDGMATAANGTGPFALVEWSPGAQVVMKRYDAYYGGSPDIPPVGPACVERVVFKVIPENSTRVAALLSGNVHLINNLPADSVAQVEANPDTQVLKVDGTRHYFLALDNTKPPFDDVRVRQAANHAVDRRLIVDKLMGGFGSPLKSLLNDATFGHAADIEGYAYDPDKARALLAEAGHADGVDVVLETAGNFKAYAEALASMLTKVGIRTRVEVGEQALLSQRWKERTDPELGHLFYASWGNGALDPIGFFDATMVTAARGNFARYSNPEVDALLATGATETDVDTRRGLYEKAERLMFAEAPVVFLWIPQDIYGASTRLTGWRPISDSRINLHDACLN